jgi:hypothetical protein
MQYTWTKFRAMHDVIGIERNGAHILSQWFWQIKSFDLVWSTPTKTPIMLP